MLTVFALHKFDCLEAKRELYFKERQARGQPIVFDAWLVASPNAEPIAGDELPT